jgi:ABC-type Fe3+ transport system permease subunit
MVTSMQIKWWYIALFIALLLAILSPLASAFPDGLERVAEDTGFVDKAHEPSFTLIPDYTFPGIQSEAIATILAGVVGTLLLFGIGLGLAYLLRMRKNET